MQRRRLWRIFGKIKSRAAALPAEHPRALQDVLPSFFHQIPTNQGRTSGFLSPGQAVTVTRVTAWSCHLLSLTAAPTPAGAAPSSPNVHHRAAKLPWNPQKPGAGHSFQPLLCLQLPARVRQLRFPLRVPQDENHPQGDPFSFLELLITQRGSLGRKESLSPWMSLELHPLVKFGSGKET